MGHSPFRLCVGIACSAALLAPALAGELASRSLKVTVDEAAKGAVSHLVSAGGTDFISPGKATSLFKLQLTREDDFTRRAYVSAEQAKTFQVESTAESLVLRYGEIGEAVKSVTCEIAARGNGNRLTWRIAVRPQSGWRVTETTYPRLQLTEKLGETAEDDCVVGGTTKGGVIANPAAKPKGKSVFFGRQPGSLACQFVSFYDVRRLFYFAAEDGLGGTKDISLDRTADGLLLWSRRFGWDASGDFGYACVTEVLEGTPEKPCAWQDAADLYRSWASKQRWCAAPLRDRKDLPEWLRAAPAMVRFYRHHFEDVAKIRGWVANYWDKQFKGRPLIAAMWGWEHRNTWCSDYFPCCPSDEAFTSLVKDIRKSGVHAFPWPSGYHWTLMYGERPDGTFEYDDRARFAKIGAPHAIWNADGKIYDRLPGWLKGGHVACMCPGDAWARTWWNRDICLELAKRGCEVIQADQVVGGGVPACWAKNHPHDPGHGPWKIESFREQLRTMRETMRTVEKDAVTAFEEPCEQFNDLIGVQDYRDCNVLMEWASVFNYVYHEYLPCFQSDLYSRTSYQWMAHCAVDGQIPFFGWPSAEECSEKALALENGDFERVLSDGTTFASWEGHAARHHVDREVKHGGESALRLETANITNHIQVARNVTMETSDFKPGVTYRLSFWLKTACKGGLADVSYGAYTPGFSARRVGGMVPFPAANEGWVHRELSFVMPDEDGLTLRLMINAGKGENRIWIDDVRLLEVAADGSTKDVVVRGLGAYHRFMKAWVELYQGEGRDWLAHGRHIRPPKLTCAMEKIKQRAINGKQTVELERPAVHHAAYVSLDGRKALVFANATKARQKVSWQGEGGVKRELELEPKELRLVRE